MKNLQLSLKTKLVNYSNIMKKVYVISKVWFDGIESRIYVDSVYNCPISAENRKSEILKEMVIDKFPFSFCTMETIKFDKLNNSQLKIYDYWYEQFLFKQEFNSVQIKEYELKN